MKLRWALMLPVVSIFATSFATQAQAQGNPVAPGMMPGSVWSSQPPMIGPGGQYGPPPGGMMPPQGVAPAGYGPPGMPPGGYGPPPGMGGYGPPPGMMGPEQPTAMMMGGPYGAAPGPYGGFEESYVGGGPGGPGGGCPACGGAGCQQCAGGHGGGHGLGNGLLGDVLGLVGPYPDGGSAAVRWYDISLEFLMLEREDSGNRVDIASAGVGGPIVLNTAQLEFDEAPSFRFSGAFQISPAANLEFTYFGLFDFEDQVTVTDVNNDLFSVVSGFGFVPLFGFDETDESDLQSIAYRSTFDSYEINYRQRWMAPNCRYQGSWLLGIRGFQLDEEFLLFTESDLTNGAPSARSNAIFTTNVNNMLTGVQVGGDVWVTLIPGLRVGGEGKAGVYGNHINVNNRIDATSLFIEPFVEEVDSDDVAFVVQAEVLATYRINYQWTAKVGYQALLVDGVGLATENFNATPPNLFFPPPGTNRVATVNDDGEVIYHGFSAGLEFMW